MMKFRMLVLILLCALCAFPALAQELTPAQPNMVSFNGFSFSFDPTLAANVNISQFAGDAPDLQQPGGPEVAHTQFVLYNELPVPESMFDAPVAIRVYDVADFAAYAEPQAQFQQLQSILAERPDLAQFMVTTADPNTGIIGTALPFMPSMPASQVIRARVQYVDTATVQGVSYITVYRQDVSPFISSEFIYTFQGISVDGAHYVSAIFRVNASVFSEDIPADFDMDTFNQNFPAYLNESVQQLNDAAPDAFTPSLTLADTVIQSFAFVGAPPVVGGPLPTAEVPLTPTAVQDPSLGGLAGVAWTLVSWGAADAQQPALANVPVTATFSVTGVGGSAGCNTYGGAFTYNNGALTISEVISTLMACAEDVMAQETAFLTALSTVTSYQIVGSQLLLNYEGGVLTFINPAALTATPTVVTETLIPTATP